MNWASRVRIPKSSGPTYHFSPGLTFERVTLGSGANELRDDSAEDRLSREPLP